MTFASLNLDKKTINMQSFTNENPRAGNVIKITKILIVILLQSKICTF